VKRVDICYGACLRSFPIQVRAQYLSKVFYPDSGRVVWEVCAEWIGKMEEQLPCPILIVTGLFFLRVRKSL